MKSSRTSILRLLASLLTCALLVCGLVGCGGSGGGDPEPAPQPTGVQFVVDPFATNAVTGIDIQGPGGTTSHNLTLQAGQEVFIPMSPNGYNASFWVYVGGGMSARDLNPRYFTVQPDQITVVNYP